MRRRAKIINGIGKRKKRKILKRKVRDEMRSAVLSSKIPPTISPFSAILSVCVSHHMRPRSHVRRGARETGRYSTTAVHTYTDPTSHTSRLGSR